MAVHTYWRVNVSAIQSGSRVRVYELEMRATKGGADQCAGGTASASTTNGVNVASRAFDNSTSLFWEATGTSGWIKYQFAAPVDVLELVVTALATGGPKTFTLEWSDDDVAWTSAMSLSLPSDAWDATVLSVPFTVGADDERVTQASALVLIADEAAERVTQAVVLALAFDAPDERVTQAAVLVLHDDQAAERVTQVAVLALVHETPCLTRRAQCWTITRLDGTVYRYTTADVPVVLFGQTFSPCQSLLATASSAGVVQGGAGDVAVNGMITDDQIRAVDLIGGKFDGATVEVWTGEWDPGFEQGFIPFRLTRGVVGKVSQSESGFTAELLSAGARLQQRPLLQSITPACRFELGDGRCPVVIGDFEVSGLVVALDTLVASDRSVYRKFFDSSRVEADGYFADGSLTWTSGGNVGLDVQVRTNESGWVSLWSPMPHPIQITDAYTLTPGCAKTSDDHTVKFGLGIVSFGGFPNLPGTDAMIETPNAKG
nr:DUF2163 domain-containing protein [Pseudoxanthomonas sp.]